MAIPPGDCFYQTNEINPDKPNAMIDLHTEPYLKTEKKLKK